MEKVIKNMNFKPLLDRAEFERLDPPKEGTMVNIRVGDEVEVKLLNDNIARVTVARSVVPEPECLFKIFVQMSADVPIEKKYYDELAKPDGARETEQVDDDDEHQAHDIADPHLRRQRDRHLDDRVHTVDVKEI